MSKTYFVVSNEEGFCYAGLLTTKYAIRNVLFQDTLDCCLFLSYSDADESMRRLDRIMRDIGLEPDLHVSERIIDDKYFDENHPDYDPQCAFEGHIMDEPIEKRA